MDKITQLEFNTMEGTVGNIIINGVPVNQKVKVETVCCGNCKNILAQFQPNQHVTSRYDYINSNIKNQIIYCPRCGYKIDYSGCEIIPLSLDKE